MNLPAVDDTHHHRIRVRLFDRHDWVVRADVTLGEHETVAGWLRRNAEEGTPVVVDYLGIRRAGFVRRDGAIRSWDETPTSQG